MEVVGSQKSPELDRAASVAAHLREQGASHIVRGEVTDDDGNPAWRVTALLPAAKLTACRRGLLRLGAARIVGLSPRVIFDRDSTSTFDNLSRVLPF
jgi:ATP phosphoribosyltransferase